MSEVRILGTGSHRRTDRDAIWARLDRVAARYAPAGIVFVHGACPAGFDAIGDAWARARGFRAEPHPAGWDSCGWHCPRKPHRRDKRPGDRLHPGMLQDYCPGAGPRRNAAMVRAGAAVCVAAPDDRSTGTLGCILLAEAARIPVEILTC